MRARQRKKNARRHWYRWRERAMFGIENPAVNVRGARWRAIINAVRRAHAGEPYEIRFDGYFVPMLPSFPAALGRFSVAP